MTKSFLTRKGKVRFAEAELGATPEGNNLRRKGVLKEKSRVESDVGTSEETQIVSRLDYLRDQLARRERYDALGTSLGRMKLKRRKLSRSRKLGSIREIVKYRKKLKNKDPNVCLPAIKRGMSLLKYRERIEGGRQGENDQRLIEASNRLLHLIDQTRKMKGPEKLSNYRLAKRAEVKLQGGTGELNSLELRIDDLEYNNRGEIIASAFRKKTGQIRETIARLERKERLLERKLDFLNEIYFEMGASNCIKKFFLYLMFLDAQSEADKLEMSLRLTR